MLIHQRIEQWILGLIKHLKFMEVSKGVLSHLTPMQKIIHNMVYPPDNLFSKVCCVAYQYFFKQQAIFVASYGCSYHFFCLSLHVEIHKSTSYIGIFCSKLFQKGMAKSFRVNQLILECQKMKVNKEEGRRKFDNSLTLALDLNEFEPSLQCM